MISRFKKSSKICSLFYRNYEISSSISPGVFTSVLNENDEDLENLRTDDTITEIKNTFDIKRWPYYIENGLQKVYPYNFKHSTYCKGRWVNRTLIDVYSNDFSLFPKEEIERRISTGILKVNGKIVNYDYKLKHSDVLSSEVHRHELPILAWAIEVIFEDDDVLVINKPASMPVHPCGLYRYNSAIFVAEHQLKLKILHVIHRLDRLTSGVIIFAKNRKKSQELHEDMKLGSIKKEYLCRVEGEFPDGVIVCNKPLKHMHYKVGIALVNPTGKMSITEFQKLSFNGKSSVVRCRPYTGRTHQIRAHLQYLGYPILNDPLYNSYAFGPEKGKHGVFHKNVDELMEDLINKHLKEWYMYDINENDHQAEIDANLKKLLSRMNSYSINKDLLDTVYKKDPSRLTFLKDCYLCSHGFQDPRPSNLFMFLHSYKYKTDKWEYQTEIPIWASDSWDVM